MPNYINTKMHEYLKVVKSVETTSSGILLKVDTELVKIDILSDDIFRIKISQGQVFDENPTFSVLDSKQKNTKFSVKKTNTLLILSTKNITIEIDKENFAIDAYRADGSVIFKSSRENGLSKAYSYLNNKFTITREFNSKDYIFGLGEKSGSFNRSRNTYTLWNTDILSPDPDHNYLETKMEDPRKDPISTEFDPYYMSIPFFYHMPTDTKKQQVAGFFIDNPYKGYFKFTDDNTYQYQFSGGQYTEYVFAGPNIKNILEEYTCLTGKMEAPPLWSLGYHQCRWYPYKQNEVLELAKNFREKEIPCDTLWLDIDYMDGFRVFTWDKEKFPNYKDMLSKLSDNEFKVVTIIDPGLKYEPGNKLFDEASTKGLLCKTENGQLYVGRVWPGRTVFPDFLKEKTRKWWGKLNSEHVKNGLAGIWNDMNEPIAGEIEISDMLFETDDGTQYSHGKIHNQYAFLMAMGTKDGLLDAMPNKRTFILSRAGCAGIQRYAANWMGDNMSRWEHLWMSIPMAMGLGISGQPFVGADVGGFGEGTTPELLIRWVQYGAFTPFFRNHNMDSKNQYPWSFGDSVEMLYKKALQERYRLMPYIYSAFMRSSQTGAPIQSPLIYDFQNDKIVAGIDDQYMFGDALLVAPIVEAGKTSRRVYLPKGTWFNWYTAEKYHGEQYITADAPMQHIPVFAKGGAIIPTIDKFYCSTANYANKIINLDIFIPDEDGETISILHEDDGLTFDFKQNKYFKTEFKLIRERKKISISATVSGDGYDTFCRTHFSLTFKNQALRNLTLNGKEIELNANSVLIENKGENFLLNLYNCNCKK